MIARHWKGVCKPERSNDYIEHLKTETFAILEAIGGFISAQILSRKTDDGVEFLIITNWKNIDAIRQFAGNSYETAVVPKRVKEMMIRFDNHVAHYEVEFEKKV